MGHSCETALLRVCNDIVTTIGSGNGAMLVLLDFSAAFNTIYHNNLSKNTPTTYFPVSRALETFSTRVIIAWLVE